MSLATIGMQAHYPIGCRWKPIPKSAPVEAPNPFRVCRMSFAATHSAGCKSSAMVETKTCPCQSQGQTSATCYNIKIHKTCHTYIWKVPIVNQYGQFGGVSPSFRFGKIHVTPWVGHHCKSGSRDIVLPPKSPRQAGFKEIMAVQIQSFQILLLLPIDIKNYSKCIILIHKRKQNSIKISSMIPLKVSFEKKNIARLSPYSKVYPTWEHPDISGMAWLFH